MFYTGKTVAATVGDRINRVLLTVGGENPCKMTPPYNRQAKWPTLKEFRNYIRPHPVNGAYQKGTKSSRFGALSNQKVAGSST